MTHGSQKSALGTIGRLGLLRTFGTYYHEARDRTDLRATLAFDTGDWRLQAGWQTLVNAADTEIPHARALVAGISRRF